MFFDGFSARRARVKPDQAVGPESTRCNHLPTSCNHLPRSCNHLSKPLQSSAYVRVIISRRPVMFCLHPVIICPRPVIICLRPCNHLPTTVQSAAPLGALLEPSWSPLGAIWRPLGALLEPSWSPLGALGELLELNPQLRGLLERFLEPLGAS